MGNDNTKPVNERIHIAVVEDNPAGIKALVESLPNYPKHDVNQLQWIDKRGRTPLIMAAKRGYLKCARVLLQNGADVNFMNCFPETRGTALQEAIYEKHERMSELLLISGANPFLANSYGSTALDVALQANFSAMIQRLKAMALHIDTACFKVPTFGGMSSAFKPKFLVLVPYHPFSSKSNHQKVTKQLLIFNDSKSTITRSRIWMHIASVKAFEGGAVRLHLRPSHPHPGEDLVTTFDRGHCLFMREENATPGAKERFQKLVVILKEASREASAGTAKAQPHGSEALKPDSSAASFNSSGTLAGSGMSRALLDSEHRGTDNLGLSDLGAPKNPAEPPGAFPVDQSCPSTPPKEQQQECQHQAQQQPSQSLTPFSAQQKPEEHHPIHSFSDTHGFRPPSRVNSGSSTPHKRSNSIWNKSGDAGKSSMKHLEHALPGESDAAFAERLASQNTAPSPTVSSAMNPAKCAGPPAPLPTVSGSMDPAMHTVPSAPSPTPNGGMNPAKCAIRPAPSPSPNGSMTPAMHDVPSGPAEKTLKPFVPQTTPDALSGAATAFQPPTPTALDGDLLHEPAVVPYPAISIAPMAQPPQPSPPNGTMPMGPLTPPQEPAPTHTSTTANEYIKAIESPPQAQASAHEPAPHTNYAHLPLSADAQDDAIALPRQPLAQASAHEPDAEAYISTSMPPPPTVKASTHEQATPAANGPLLASAQAGTHVPAAFAAPAAPAAAAMMQQPMAFAPEMNIGAATPMQPPQVEASSSRNAETEEAAKQLHSLQKEKAAAIQEQLWAIEEKRLGIQEQRLGAQLEQEVQASGEESKKKAGGIQQQLWLIEERKLAIQEARLTFQLQQEA